jgi:hypothetical protein
LEEFDLDEVVFWGFIVLLFYRCSSGVVVRAMGCGVILNLSAGFVLDGFARGARVAIALGSFGSLVLLIVP